MDNRRARRKNPSFSSSLLDEIYRSFDDQTTPAASGATEGDDHKTEDHYRIGKEMDQNVNRMLFNKVDGRKKSAFPQSLHLNSSSDSSFWTSSEYGTSKTSFGQSKLAVRTSFSTHCDDRIYVSQRKLENGSEGFVQAKSKALKTYGDLKKSKANQPLSPGSRLSSFLSSLFNTSTGTGKKTIIDETKYTSAACSSASSFTRSCFSKTPSSRAKLSHSVKRSVRFYPVISVSKDEDCRYSDNGRRNHDNILARNLIRGEEIRENNRQVLKNYEKKLEECKMMNDDEDCESCASSDLFELDNLDSVTASRHRYSEELPVYETTSLDVNRAIAHGLHIEF